MQWRKEGLKKVKLDGIRFLTSAIPVRRSNRLSPQANLEQVIKFARNIPGKNGDEW